MKFVLANWGTRGEVEPYVTVGRELVRRGHDVHMAVAPEMVGFTEAAGPTAVAYGPELKAILDPHRDFWAGLFANPWKIRELGRLSGEYSAPLSQCRPEVAGTLTSLAEGSDLLLTGMNFEDDALNVAEYCDIPLATLHIFPLRANGQLLPYLPAPFARSATRALDWLAWRGGKKLEDAQRREFGLPEATNPWPHRISERGSLEIQAYDEVCYPGLAAEWAKWGGRRPFVGALTMELPTAADEEVAAWIAAGTPPICFGFGSVGVESAADTLAMISSACAQLGERALVCAAGSDYSDVPHSEHVKVVGVMNYAAALPACRAFVHHGGSGTTNAGLRAGLPTLILWTLPDQGLWGARVKRLKVGTARRFSATTEKSLVADLRTILAPECLTHARDLAARMTKPAESVAIAADLVENFARLKRVG
ncbi:glycosyl transferase family 1 [Mycobacterium paraense]|uniref:Glycosyl transferase family 1 n=1 Tax=Mycobacterium paraense TaxID=767916 RepID=A0ABX3VFC7_9MYCO|nr:glycosyltransferase [Mycobacterium paraense]ORW26757.1 glycosyl transferase family 1 [Mycobacterium paraense]ORW43397.1 glycosyl transferase family 1 [Mycobacterium paraense]